jgi:hypothetical protein
MEQMQESQNKEHQLKEGQNRKQIKESQNKERQ